MSAFLVSALATLLVTIDPPGMVPVFLTVTEGMTARQRRQVGLIATLIAAGVLVAFALGGEAVLRTLGVSLPAFRVAGGLLLFWIAFEMLFAREANRRAESAAVAITRDHIRNVAAFPLAVPLMAGPGAITAVMLLAGRARGDAAQLGGLVAVIGVAMGATLVTCFLAVPLDRWLGVTVRTVMTRLLGMLLAALAVQFVADGIRAYIASSA